MARSYVGIAALILLAVLNSSALGDSFPWASHFSTKTPYRVYTDNIPAATAPPAGCSLVFANYIARYVPSGVHSENRPHFWSNKT